MTSLATVADIRTYLLDAGWQRHEETWRGASIWSDADGREVLVPANNDLADTDLRIREVLSVLTLAEGRTAAEIVTDISTPFDDIQLYRTLPGDGLVSLSAGLETLKSVHHLISVAARTVVLGPQPNIPRGSSHDPAGELLRRIHLGPSNSADCAITVRIPLAAPSGPPMPEARAGEGYPSGEGRPPDAAAGTPLARQVGHQLRTAVFAAQLAATQASADGDLAVFDASVAAGVSANLCDALVGLAGRGRGQPFEITFRWGRGLPTDVPADSVPFSSGTATAMQAGADRLRRLGGPPTPGSPPIAGPDTATVAGLVKSLRGQSPNGGWLITLRGYLTPSGGTDNARTVRVLLDSLAAYDRAITAHRSQVRVRARGELSTSGRSAELHVNDDDFEIIEGDA